jgi:hypothetical protein
MVAHLFLGLDLFLLSILSGRGDSVFAGRAVLIPF